MTKKLIFLLTFLFIFVKSYSQTNLLLNGDFENNISPHDSINCTTPAFNSLMRDVNSFGWEPNLDIITSNGYCNWPEHGKWLIAFTGGGSDRAALKMSGPMITNGIYKLSFWNEACNFATFQFVVGISNNDTTMGDTIYEGDMTVQSVWTNNTYIFIAQKKDSGTYLTFEGTRDIGCWGQLDNVSLTLVSISEQWTTPSLNNGPIEVNPGNFIISDSLCKNDTLSDIYNPKINITNIYPSPVHNILNVSISSSIYSTEEYIEIYNMFGYEEISELIDSKGNYYNVDVSNLSTGNYFLRIYDYCNNNCSKVYNFMKL